MKRNLLQILIFFNHLIFLMLYHLGVGDLAKRSYLHLFNQNHIPQSEMQSFFTILKYTIEHSDTRINH